MRGQKKRKENISNLNLPNEFSIETAKKLLAKYPIDVNTVFMQKSGFHKTSTTLLYSAISQQNEELIDWLLTQKVDINLELSFRGPPLHVAIEMRDLKTVQKLVSLGADLNSLNSTVSYTPLGIACMCGQIKIFKYLIENGADVNLLPFNGSDRSLLQTCIYNENIKMTKFALSKGADVNYKQSDGSTALIRAAKCGNFKLFKLLIDSGADINCVYETDNDTFSLIHTAIISNSCEIVKFLLNLDEPIVDLNILTGKKKRSALHLAFKHLWRCIDFIAFLLTAGADVSVEDCNGMLPIDISPEFNSHENEDKSVLEKHLVKLIVVDLPICQRNKDKIKDKWESYAVDCRNEVARMKSIKIGDVNTTFYDVLHFSNHHLARRVQCLETDYNLEENEEKLGKRFPLYGAMLAFKLAKAQRRMKRFMNAEEEIMKIFICLRLPFDFCRKMFRYLNDSDLKIIVGEKVCS